MSVSKKKLHFVRPLRSKKSYRHVNKKRLTKCIKKVVTRIFSSAQMGLLVVDKKNEFPDERFEQKRYLNPFRPSFQAALLRYAIPSAPIDSVKHHSPQSTAPNN